MNSVTQQDRAASIDWEVAVSTAARLVRPGPVVPRAEADVAVGRLRELAVDAEAHVRELTGLGHGLPLRAGEVVDRPGWVRAAAQGLSVLTDSAAPRQGGVLSGVVSGTAGVQAGVVLAFLSSRVLGQYDPFSGDGRLLLVAPNIVGTQRALNVPGEDFSMWVCLHECTHRLQFTGVPWLAGHFSGLVTELLESMDNESPRLRDLPKRLREADGPVGLIELFQTPEQRAALDRLIAVSTLLEGHADHVMDAVGPDVVPSVAVIRRRFTDRRSGGGLLDRVLRSLLGVEAKVRQYAEGAAFTRHVVDEVGMTGFNAVWSAPEALPTRAEIADPAAWLRRVAP
ncbi:zinc-dependent metalloprotease [Actinosynnema pretiosum subsp. pretiosum]|uniref:Zinc-dependent metalloprotease n=1 Tax=Actinosynnema pretiosum subsp. pretiosum TaxID=103721 RepID=A0AA45L1U3_9PSEU|nr:zinc-dependent metalloprotease [Actinosynnema mirum]QUF01646.1 zinc-dependent metalloprotease [Actinosynnema pretiosum subsp. pretiosum]